MRKCVLLLLSALLMVSLWGCTDNSTPVTTPTAESPTEPSTAATEPMTEATEPVWEGYVSPSSAYTYYYTEGRDLQWEEDLIFFADSHLSNNQLLRNRLFTVSLPGVKTDAANFYDSELHTAFLEAVNALIPEIGNLTDNEILYRIQMISALFGDAHTSVYLDDGDIYPIFFMPMYEDGEWVFYTVLLPQKNEKLLFTKLIAINDYPLDTVMERIRCFDSYENEYGFIHSLSFSGSAYLSLSSALEAAGICAVGDTWASYTLMDAEGNTYSLNIKAESELTTRLTGIYPSNVLAIPFWYGYSENYWYTTDLGDNTLYIRISTFYLEENESYADFAGSLTVEYSKNGPFDKIIVDLRENGGGVKGEGWRSIISNLSRMEFEEFYVLVDGGTYSNSMLFASELKYQIPELQFVGSHTGEAPGFFAGLYPDDYIMPNCGVEFTVPTQYYQAFEANPENTLIPDVVIYMTISDYMSCRDAVLEYVLAQ